MVQMGQSQKQDGYEYFVSRGASVLPKNAKLWKRTFALGTN